MSLNVLASRRALPILGQERDVDRAARPIYAVWELTLRCDLACAHCGSRAGRARPDELSTREALDVVAQLAALGTREVTIIGGEAYLRDDWLDIVHAIRAHGMDCTMTTGGRQLTEERARAAKEAGVQSVSVSVDGLRATHDRLRGVKGSFDAALRAIANLRAVGLRVTTNTQFSAPALREIEPLFDVLVEQGIRAWQVQLTVAMGRAADDPSLLLQPFQVLEVLAILHRLRPKMDRAGVSLWAGNNVGYFGPHEEELRGHLRRGHTSGCGAGRSSIGIEANGDVKGCPSLPTADYVGGNVRDLLLEDIWRKSPPLRFTRDRTVDDLWGFCRTCYYADTCRAGCTWTSHVLFGRAGNNPYCHHRALELLARGKRERLVKVEDAPNVPFDHGRFELVEEDWPRDALEHARRLVATSEGFLLDETNERDERDSRCA